MTDRNAGEQDLLIIRRGGSAELDIPKGGVWKIAYADFMTAMMAFFLVMWLINATSETTKTGIANYFNPIKLSDGTQLPQKGLRDPELIEPEPAGPGGHDTSGPSSEPRQNPQDGAAKPSRGKVARHSEDALFRDPYAVLAAIAAGADGSTGLHAGGAKPEHGESGEPDRIGSDPYRDPFDPPARILVAPRPAREAPTPSVVDRSAFDRQEERAPAMRTAESGQKPGAGVGDEPAAVELARMAYGAVTAAADLHTDGKESRFGAPAFTDRILDSLSDEVASDPMPNVTVTTGDDGLLISLADQVDFGMFAIGSAEPLPETIAVMAKIAEALKDLPGQVIIRGHTDGRPFRSDSYDNWRLSMARAHMAYHMLVRGGLDEARVSRIEGHADRDLKAPGDPDAAENRRIEILVQAAKP